MATVTLSRKFVYEYEDTSMELVTNFIINDGGRAEAGYKGRTRDCVVRAIAIATGGNYKVIYREINSIGLRVANKKSVARNGVPLNVMHLFMEQAGFEYVVLPQSFKDRKNLLNYIPPSGKVILNLAGHVVASVDGVLHDTFDTRASKYGRRIVRGYFRLKA